MAMATELRALSRCLAALEDPVDLLQVAGPKTGSGVDHLAETFKIVCPPADRKRPLGTCYDAPPHKKARRAQLLRSVGEQTEKARSRHW